MKTSNLLRGALLTCSIAFAVSCTDHEPDPVVFTPEEFSKGELRDPLSVTKGDNNRLWVTEQGIKDDSTSGRVSLITPDGVVHPAIVGFRSETSVEGMPSGVTHAKYKDGILYILHGVDGRLYKANVASWNPGDAPIDYATLPFEELGSFSKSFLTEIPDSLKESNLYNLAWGPEGDLFITDAAANLIIRRKPDGSKTRFASFPDIDNPLPIGPPKINFVPTGIAWDGSKFYVTSLTGFPFAPEAAEIKQVDQFGNVTDYQKGFTTLVDVELTDSNKPLVVHFANFENFAFVPGTGSIQNESKGVVLADQVMPTDIEKVYTNTYYVVSLGLKKVLKLTY